MSGREDSTAKITKNAEIAKTESAAIEVARWQDKEHSPSSPPIILFFVISALFAVN